MKTIKYKVKGTAPLLMHSDKYVDPLHPKAKELKSYTSKRNKTDDDHKKIAELSWYGAMHHNDKEEPIVPGAAVWRAIQNAAKMKKLGKHVEKGLVIREREIPLQFKDQGKSLKKLYGEGRSDYVSALPRTVQRSKVMRYRPVFKEWGLEFTIDFDTDILDVNQVSEMVDGAGKYIGLLDERPFYGKFEVVEEK